jgi:intracellular multiplication protein IcmL
MKNDSAAVTLKLSDPDFQASLVTKCIAMTTGMFLVVVTLVIHDVYVWLNPPAPKFFFVDGKNPPRPVTALDSPIVSDQELLDWTAKAVRAPYNLDFHNYSIELNTAAKNFTHYGWNSYAVSYIGSGNFEVLKKAYLVCWTISERAPLITETLMYNGVLGFRIEYPIIQTCQNSQITNNQQMMLQALVIRTNAEDHPDGLAVEQLVAIAKS